MTLRDYQENFALRISQELSYHKKIIAQLSTGGGKTVVFANIIKRYIEKSGKSVLLLVHREELVTQASRTIYQWSGIVAERVAKGMVQSKCYIGMVETVNNLLKKTPDFFNDVGLVIIDEAHTGNFKKVHPYFPDQYIIGFTATPIASTKKDPLKNYFNSIVVGASITELIAHGALVKNFTMHVKGSVDRTQLRVVRGEFDEKQMGQEFSKGHNVENTLRQYMEFALGTKTIIFNCTIDHSKKVHELFLSHGLNSRHLDSNCTPEERAEILRWFKETPDAVLNNVNILTAGFDEATIQTVIVNRSTLSLALWIQTVGRGARLSEGKTRFLVLDMGGNARTFGDWDSEDRDWLDLFWNPGKKKDGIAPTKECPVCFGICHASVRNCNNIDTKGNICGHEFPVKVKVEIPVELVAFNNSIDVSQLIADNDQRKEYYPFFRIPASIAHAAKRKIKEFTDDHFTELMPNVHTKCKEWCHILNKKYNNWHKETATKTFIEELKKHYPKWEPAQE